jgi:CRISPR system Cascade subunit CasA
VNLLIDPLLTIHAANGGSRSVTLPDLLVALANDEVVDFPRLRPHQAAAWHVLLVQFATLALLAAGKDRCDSADGWRALLRAMTPGFDRDEPWCLVVDDWMRPAFLQPPCTRESERADFKREYDCADALDVLMTSKNHDQKAERMIAATAEEWLFALVALQTTEGFLGAGNYGIARMNGGFASRPVMRCSSASLGVGGQVFRDVNVLLAHANEVQKSARSLGVGGATPAHRLLWLLPWDGADSLGLEHFHPLAIEVCRRVRLVGSEPALRARSASSKVARVSAKDAKGVIGDPWIPVDLKGIKAFTVTHEGFSYRRMVALLDDAQYGRPLMAKATRAEQASGVSMVIHAAALARGQGKTEGLHSRRVELPPRAAARFTQDNQAFTKRSTAFVELAAAASGKALRPALIQLVQGKEEPDWKKPSNGAMVDPWTNRFDACVDRDFYAVLSQTFQDERSDKDAEAVWSQHLSAIARQVFDMAANAAPSGDQRRVLAVARADNMLLNALRKQLPALRAPKEETTDVPD